MTDDRFGNDAGIINIIAVAVTLPIIVLLAIAAADIVRIIINKQELYGALQSGYDHLLNGIGVGTKLAEELHGQNHCAVTADNTPGLPSGTPCNFSCDRTPIPTCTGSCNESCTGSGDLGWSTTKPPLQEALQAVKDDVKDSFGPFNMSSTNDDDLSVVVAAYNLVVYGFKGGTPDLSQTVVNRVSLGREEFGPYKTMFNEDALDAIIDHKFVTPGNVKLGSLYGYHDESTPNATHITIVFLWATFRVNHAFTFPSWLHLGITPIDKTTKQPIPYQTHETYISASMIKVLPYNIRLDK